MSMLKFENIKILESPLIWCIRSYLLCEMGVRPRQYLNKTNICYLNSSTINEGFYIIIKLYLLIKEISTTSPKLSKINAFRAGGRSYICPANALSKLGEYILGT